MTFFCFSFVKNTTLRNKRLFQPVCVYFSSLPKPRPQKSSFYYNSCHVTVYVIPRRRRRRECENCYCTLILLQALFCHQKFVISSLFPLINWKCSQQYLQGWSELTIVPKDVNLRKMLTSKVKITRVNWTGPSYVQRYATVKNAPTTGASQRPEASGSSTMIALREMHASASGRIE